MSCLKSPFETTHLRRGWWRLMRPPQERYSIVDIYYGKKAVLKVILTFNTASFIFHFCCYGIQVKSCSRISRTLT